MNLIIVLAIWFALNIAMALALYLKPFRPSRERHQLAEGLLRRSI
jgi:hypothetical protein